jgi:ATP-dependent DNA ligase
VKSKDSCFLPSAKVRFIEPMYAKLVNELPEGKEWLYEVKFDGYRCLAGRDAKGVTGPIGSLQNRFLRYCDRPRKK